jgi:hypothetical protein
MTKTEHPRKVVRYGFIAAFAPLLLIELFRDIGEEWRVYAWANTEIVALVVGMVLWVAALVGLGSVVEMGLAAVGL